MKITNLELDNYRNYEKLALEFNPDLNIFLGENAQGKTNLLESIYLLAFTKSYRTNREKELINFPKKKGNYFRGCGKKYWKIISRNIFN